MEGYLYHHLIHKWRAGKRARAFACLLDETGRCDSPEYANVEHKPDYKVIVSGRVSTAKPSFGMRSFLTRTSPRVPSILNNWDTASLQLFDFAIHDFTGSSTKMELVSTWSKSTERLLDRQNKFLKLVMKCIVDTCSALEEAQSFSAVCDVKNLRFPQVCQEWCIAQLLRSKTVEKSCCLFIAPIQLDTFLGDSEFSGELNMASCIVFGLVANHTAMDRVGSWETLYPPWHLHGQLRSMVLTWEFQPFYIFSKPLSLLAPVPEVWLSLPFLVASCAGQCSSNAFVNHCLNLGIGDRCSAVMQQGMAYDSQYFRNVGTEWRWFDYTLWFLKRWSLFTGIATVQLACQTPLLKLPKPNAMEDVLEDTEKDDDRQKYPYQWAKLRSWCLKCGNLKAENKRKSDDTARNNQNQLPNKRQNTVRAYAAGNGDRRPYEGPRPLCSKCVCLDVAALRAFQEGLSKIEEQQQPGAKPRQQCRHGSRIVITPTALDHDYNVEYVRCTMPLLSVREEMIVHIPAQEYLNEGMSRIIDKYSPQPSQSQVKGGRRIKDVPVVQEFPEVFPEDLPGIPPTVQNEGASGATTGTYGQRLHKTKLQGIDNTDNEETAAPLQGSDDLLHLAATGRGTISRSRDCTIETDARKAEVQGYYESRPSGLFVQPEILMEVGQLQMDFVMKLPKQIVQGGEEEGKREKAPKDKWQELYLKEVFTMNGIPVSIIVIVTLDSHQIWKSLQKALGTSLDMSTAYHPQTDGQSRLRNIQTFSKGYA
ncbi:hypothetical protein Tco_0407878 [Tanacetum coccineum]